MCVPPRTAELFLKGGVPLPRHAWRAVQTPGQICWRRWRWLSCTRPLLRHCPSPHRARGAVTGSGRPSSLPQDAAAGGSGCGGSHFGTCCIQALCEAWVGIQREVSPCALVGRKGRSTHTCVLSASIERLCVHQHPAPRICGSDFHPLTRARSSLTPSAEGGVGVSNLLGCHGDSLLVHPFSHTGQRASSPRQGVPVSQPRSGCERWTVFPGIAQVGVRAAHTDAGGPSAHTLAAPLLPAVSPQGSGVPTSSDGSASSGGNPRAPDRTGGCLRVIPGAPPPAAPGA